MGQLQRPLVHARAKENVIVALMVEGELRRDREARLEPIVFGPLGEVRAVLRCEQSEQHGQLSDGEHEREMHE